MEWPTIHSLGRYQIKAILGEGGMGVVYRAFDPNLKRDVAIKVIHPHLMHTPGFKERFLQEALVAARLNHPGVVQVHDSGEANGALFIVMAYIPGGNLKEMLEELRQKGQWVALKEAVELVQQVSLAVDYVHRHGVLHRDIKPGNIMLDPEPCGGLPYRPVLTDLGLAKLVESGVETMTGISLGTPAYMSPEQAQGLAVDVRSDVYSLGALLYHLCVGRPPFPAKTITEAIRYHVKELPPPPRQYNPLISYDLEQVILKALEKDPAKRFSDAAQFGETLGKLLPNIGGQPGGISTAVDIVGGQSLQTLLEQSLVKQRGKSIWDDFPRAGSQVNEVCIQVMEPGKPVFTVPIKGQVISVGRAADNQVVLGDPKISRNHLRIEQEGTGYKVIDQGSSNGTFLGGTRLLKGVAHDWSPEQPLRVGDTYMRLLREKEAGGTQMEFTEHPGIPLSESRFSVSIDNAQLSVEPGNVVMQTLKIRNQGNQVDHYLIGVDGTPSGWVKNLPVEPVKCMPGEEQTISLSIMPPRAPQSRAGRYPMGTNVTCLGDRSQVIRAESSLTVTPFYQYASQMHPEKIRAGQLGRITVYNQGNNPDAYRLVFSDRADELNFQPPQPQFNIPEGKAVFVDFQATPRQRPWIGGEKSYPFTAQVIPSRGAPQTLNGEATGRARFPSWLLPVLTLLCVLLAAGAFALYPAVFPPPAPTATATLTITPIPTEPGQPVFDTWCIFPSSQPPSPPDTCPTQIFVTKGQKITIQWQVSNTDGIQLSPLGDRPNLGQEDYLPLEDTVFTLKAYYVGNSQKAPKEGTIRVIVNAPTPTYTLTPTPTLTQTLDFAATMQIANLTSMAKAQATYAAQTKTAAAVMVITNASISVQPNTYSGTCPTNFAFSAKITANNPGTVVYHWERSDGGIGQNISLYFASAGSQDVTNQWTLSSSGSYWENIHVISPNELSAGIDFNLTCTVPQPVIDLAKGLMDYYPFTGNANDGSGHGNNGTVNGPILTSDRKNNPNSAYSFDGQNDSINIPNNASLQVTGQITLAAWINPLEQKTQEIFRKGQSARSSPYDLALSATGDIILQLTVNSQFVDVRTHGYSLNQWIFVVGTYDGSTAKLFVNGVLKASQPTTGSILTDSSTLYIGTRLNLASDTFRGKIDEVRVYNRALSTDEITALYKQ